MTDERAKRLARLLADGMALAQTVLGMDRPPEGVYWDDLRDDLLAHGDDCHEARRSLPSRAPKEGNGR